MKIVIAVLFVLSALTTSITYAEQTDFSLYTDKGPTLSGEINYFMMRKNGFSGWQTDIEHKRRFFMQSWGRSIESAPTENRAYLAALGIDLYNSIPPDLMPPPITQEEMDSGAEIDPIGFMPYKHQLSGDFNALRPGGVDLMYRESSWNAIPRLEPERQMIAVERNYLLEYLREQIANGSIIIDNNDAPASIDASKIDVRNPTYYKTIRDYMEKMKPAMEARISPWEAERYLATQGSAQTKPEATTIPVQPTDVPNSISEQTPIDMQTIIYKQPRWVWYAVLIGLVVLVSGVLYLRRKK